MCCFSGTNLLCAPESSKQEQHPERYWSVWNTTTQQNDTINSELCLKFLSLFPVVTACVSPACQQASARLSTSADPFTQPCDYFLFTCGSDRLSQPENGGRQRGQGIPGHPQNQNGKSVWSERRRQSKEREDRGLRQEKILDRKTVLLQYLREILGRSLQPSVPSLWFKGSMLHHCVVWIVFFCIFLSESNYSVGSSAVQKAKGFYHSCVDTRSIESAGAEPFLTLIQRVWYSSILYRQTIISQTGCQCFFIASFFIG